MVLSLDINMKYLEHQETKKPGMKDFAVLKTNLDGPKSRTDIPNLLSNYDYTIKLYARNSVGFSQNPALIKNSTITYEQARPPTPSNFEHRLQPTGDVNFTWAIDKNEFEPDNFTLLYRIDEPEFQFEKIVIENNRPRPSKLIKNLRPNSNITVILFASNQYGHSNNVTKTFETDAGAVLEGNIWFIAVLIGVGITFILIIIFCFVQHSKTGKYPVQNKTIDMMVEGHDEATPEDKNLLPPQSPSPCKMISPHSAAYVSEMRKVSSESDSIVGFGEEGNATRHYTENGSFIGQYTKDNSQRNSIESGNSPEESDLKTFAPQ